MFRLNNEIMEFCGQTPAIPSNIDTLDYFIYAHELTLNFFFPEDNYLRLKELLLDKFNIYFYGKDIEPAKKWWLYHLIILKVSSENEELLFAKTIIDNLIKKAELLSTEELKDYVNEISFVFYKLFLGFPILRPKLLMELKSSLAVVSDISKALPEIFNESVKIFEGIDVKQLDFGAYDPLLKDTFKVDMGFMTSEEMLADLFILNITDGLIYVMDKKVIDDKTPADLKQRTKVFCQEFFKNDSKAFEVKLYDVLRKIFDFK